MGLLTLEDWHALPEDNTHVHELVDGVVHAGPKPDPHHQVAAANLMVNLNRRLPASLIAYTLIDGHYETMSTEGATLTVDVRRLTDRQY